MPVCATVASHVAALCADDTSVRRIWAFVWEKKSKKIKVMDVKMGFILKVFGY